MHSIWKVHLNQAKRNESHRAPKPANNPVQNETFKRIKIQREAYPKHKNTNNNNTQKKIKNNPKMRSRLWIILGKSYNL